MARSRARHAVAAALALSALALLWPGPGAQRLQTSVTSALPQSLPLAGGAAGVETLPALEASESGPVGCNERPLSVPSGVPPRVTCGEARAIVAEAQARFAGPVVLPSALEFEKLLLGWLDPHGLWSAAPDAPTASAVHRRAAGLLHELTQSPASQEPCAVAAELGEELRAWVHELAAVYEKARAEPPLRPAEREYRLFSDSVFQDDPVTRPGRQLARTLGERVGAFVRAHAELGVQTESAAKSRYFPGLSRGEWAEVLLAAAVRAYVPALDLHGEWAPLEEEWSLYAEDPGLEGGPRLWGEIQRSALGVRILRDAAPPLESGDLVLSVDAVPTVGMPLEQVEQLGRLEPTEGSVRRVVLLRGARQGIQELEVDLQREADPAAAELSLEVDRVRFGDGVVLVVRIADVPDDLGVALGRTFAESSAERVRGVLLDLRGNGGGSTDGAAAALGTLLPGVPLFPLAARGRLMEVMRASVPPREQQWTGPLAVLVDGYTASAAEMIAGATAAYARGPVLGTRTFGKGCIQEYADDHVGRGVLRVTTFVFSSPDGAPVQRRGVRPDILLPLPPAREHESDSPLSLAEYPGPDVRDVRSRGGAPWPTQVGAVGPCKDRAVCAALSRLGRPPSARAARARRTMARAVATGSSAARP